MLVRSLTPSSLEPCGCRGDAVDVTVHEIQLVYINIQLCCVSSVDHFSSLSLVLTPSFYYYSYYYNLYYFVKTVVDGGGVGCYDARF